MIRTFCLIILIGLFNLNLKGQVSFSTVESKLLKSKNELIYTSLSTKLKFPLKRHFTLSPQDNFVTLDNQIIQIMTLKFDGFKKDVNGKKFNNQKELLYIYSNYELEYFKRELGVEVIAPNNQWVMVKSKGWFIWYFKIGKVTTQMKTQTEIQLFATTIIGNKILIINAPILKVGDFSESALIVNELMEALTITKQ